jgi:hypothetical protein
MTATPAGAPFGFASRLTPMSMPIKNRVRPDVLNKSVVARIVAVAPVMRPHEMSGRKTPMTVLRMGNERTAQRTPARVIGGRPFSKWLPSARTANTQIALSA